MWYWYKIVTDGLTAIGIIMLSFGIWGIVCWDQYSKFLANINLLINKIKYNKGQ